LDKQYANATNNSSLSGEYQINSVIG